ncbi:hypothetical protein [Mycobacteroides abscessus]|uniref:hypothetical protein n=1 Tax=Mycobacteroides abscessus TaxID=36809 RepID=UPI003990E944
MLGKVRPFLRRLAEAHPQVLIIALAEAAPAGVTYTAGRVGDGSDFVFMLQLAEGVDNPLVDIPGALDFRARVAGWAGEAVAPQLFTVLGRYEG